MIYFCIPAYNEERTVGPVLWKIRRVMADFPRDYEILVRDDASTDATPDVLEPYGRILPLTVRRNRERQGYAASLEALLREAVRRTDYPRRDIALPLQADLTEGPEHIPALVKRIESGADVVTTAAAFHEAGVARGTRWARRASNFLLRRLPWPEPVTDPFSGFRAYRIVTLAKALEARGGRPLVEWSGWAANADLLRTVLPYARRVDEVEIDVRFDRRRRATRVRPLETALRLAKFAWARGGGAVAIAEALDDQRSENGRERRSGAGAR